MLVTLTRETCYRCGKPIVWAPHPDGPSMAYDVTARPFTFGQNHAIVVFRRDGALCVVDAETARPIPSTAHYRHGCFQ